VLDQLTMYIVTDPARTSLGGGHFGLGLGPSDARVQACQRLGAGAKGYAAAVAALKCELALPFGYPRDPGLVPRIRRLRTLFQAIPAADAEQLLKQLQTRTDSLARLFHYRLSTPSRTRLLKILADKVGTAPPSVAPSPPLVWFTAPLPPSETKRFDAAWLTLDALVQKSTDPAAWRYRCWLDKLKKSDTDDRVITWAKICPATSGAVGAAYVVGACDITRGMPVNQATIEKSIRSTADVDTAGQALGLMTHMRSAIVVAHEMTSLPLENFKSDVEDAGRALDKLEKWSTSPMGGSSAMPPAYRALKEWLRQKQGDPKSVYSCF
jgi:hypothetical protein